MKRLQFLDRIFYIYFQMDQIPKTLFKYIGWSDEESDVRKDILYKNILHFANPLSFNDPFDSMLPVLFHEDYYETERFHKEFMQGMCKIGKYNYTEDEINEKAKRYVNDPAEITYSLKKMTEGVRKQIIENIRISCFTTDPENILMWSHYANCHRGICIGFDTELFNRHTTMIEKVTYANEFPKLDSLTNIPILITKSLHWEYEQEYRLINASNVTQMNFDKKAIIRVIIGHKMNESLRLNLLDYLSIYYPNIDILISIPNSKGFKIDLIKVN